MVLIYYSVFFIHSEQFCSSQMTFNIVMKKKEDIARNDFYLC